MNPRTLALQSLLADALSEPLGLVLRTNDPARARQQLYSARAQSSDPSFAQLQIRIWPGPDGDLVIVKGEAPRAKPPVSGLDDIERLL